MLVGLGLSLVSDTSDRPGQQGHAFQDKKAIFAMSAHFRQKWTHGAGHRQTPKISRPAGQDFGPADMGGGVGLGTRTLRHFPMCGCDEAAELRRMW